MSQADRQTDKEAEKEKKLHIGIYNEYIELVYIYMNTK